MFVGVGWVGLLVDVGVVFVIADVVTRQIQLDFWSCLSLKVRSILLVFVVVRTIVLGRKEGHLVYNPPLTCLTVG
jgi:hypothetical protein